MKYRCSGYKLSYTNQTCQNCKYVEKRFTEFPCDECEFQDKWESLIHISHKIGGKKNGNE